jgi:hypothetical protein
MEDDFPRSDSCRWHKCEACEHLHLVLLDEEDEVIASAIISVDMLKSMLEAINGAPAGAIQ